ncbi:MAG: hypothetical protein ER33_14810 [Cyanobium sp. CACIAM 14]|nr:MAG: hypothetical protein ER33_14810 [Cyanobium sp. CACIAM 14]
MGIGAGCPDAAVHSPAPVPMIRTVIALHHLPRRAQNLQYIFALALSPLVNVTVSATMFERLRHLAEHGGRLLPEEHWIFSLSQFVLAGILLFLGVNLIRILVLGHQRIRRTLLVFGLLASLDLLLNLMAVAYSIYSFRVGSFFLLATSAGIYLSLNLTFFFWYWYVDYPTQVRHLHDPDHPCAIVFPSETAAGQHRRLPAPIDYLYFTLMTSNTLGPPENHSPVGPMIKVLQLFHSSVMLVLLVLIVSRAVNTLS